MGYFAAAMSVYGMFLGSKAAARSEKLNAEALAFEKERYSRWVTIYGDIEENLGKYFENLTPETLIANDLVKEAEGFAKSQEKVKALFAQRGLKDSGLELSTLTNQEFASAETRAGIRASAEQRVANAQQSFVNKGAKDPGANVTQLISNEATRQANFANQTFAASASLLNTGLEDIFGGIKESSVKPEKPRTPTAAEGATIQ